VPGALSPESLRCSRFWGSKPATVIDLQGAKRKAQRAVSCGGKRAASGLLSGSALERMQEEDNVYGQLRGAMRHIIVCYIYIYIYNSNQVLYLYHGVIYVTPYIWRPPVGRKQNHLSLPYSVREQLVAELHA
jgi:hypothetical protein